jgi:hypothetical protein
MSETMRDDGLLLSKGQTLLETIKARIAELEFPAPKSWSSIDRTYFALITDQLVEHSREAYPSKQANLERTVETLYMMVKYGFWWEYDDPGSSQSLWEEDS